MSILDRLQTLIRSEWHAVRPRGGREDVQQTVRDARTAYRENRVLERRLSEQYETLLDDAQRWEDRALAALRRNDERLAHEALRRKQRVDDEAAVTRDQLDRCRRELGDLRSALEALRMRVDANRDRAGKPTAAIAPPSPRHYGTSDAAAVAPPPPWAEDDLLRSGLDDDLESRTGMASSFDRLDEVAAGIAEQEARLAVDTLLDPDAEARALDARFDTLHRDQAIAELRARAATTPEESGDDDPDGGADDSALDRLRKRMDDA
jgi:phage shock protein A